MLNSTVTKYESKYGGTAVNLRKSPLLKELNQLLYDNNLNEVRFCVETLLSERIYRNIHFYRSENYTFTTLSAIFIACRVPLARAETLFHLAGYHLASTPQHNIVRFALEERLSIEEADDLLFAETNKHFYRGK